MARIRLLIAEDNVEFQEELRRGLSDYYDIVGVANNGSEAIAMLEELEPDVMLLDVVMPCLDGYGVLGAMKYNGAIERVKVIMISELAGDTFVIKAMNMGASYYMLKPVNMDSLRAHIESIARGGIRPQHSVNKEMEEKIANIFLSVGIPAHIKGYQFLREAIKMAIEEPDIINSITKKLYPSIATTFNTSASKVERAIRHAIEVAWARGKIENINSIFGIKVYSSNEKPTNGEFIALVADKMLIESAS